MKSKVEVQRLPASGPARELLRVKGQFWTPAWVAEAMVAYVMAGGSNTIFDPAVGAGAFFKAAKKVAAERGIRLELCGAEIDPEVLREAEGDELSEGDLANVRITDFVLSPTPNRYQAVIANPPYIRHHRLSPPVKSQLKIYGAETIGAGLDGRAGLHIYFLIRALSLLEDGGRLAFIVPADTCEGVFAPTLWRWITANYRLEAIITFKPDASPFPNVDTNPLILLIRKGVPEATFQWAQVTRAGTNQLSQWIAGGLNGAGNDDLIIYQRDIAEGMTTGFSRPPTTSTLVEPVLTNFASVMRGIATGANEFFFLTRQEARRLDIPPEFLLPAVGRTRDVTEAVLTSGRLEELDRAGRPTLLFSPDGRPLESFPPPVRGYLQKGSEAGLPDRALIRQRRPWYKMETRRVPSFLFAYLGRRNARFIRNLAGVVPLTGFLCVYPRREDQVYVDKLWKVLCHPQTIANLSLVGKSYGGGAIKVEPRALEQLPLPTSVVLEAGIEPFKEGEQLSLL